MLITDRALQLLARREIIVARRERLVAEREQQVACRETEVQQQRGQLAVQLAALAAAVPAPMDRVLLADGWAWDAQDKELSYLDEPFFLTARETEILAVLAEQAGHWVPDPEILKRVWASDWPEPALITVNVSRLHARCRQVCPTWSALGRRNGGGVLVQRRYRHGEWRVRVPEVA